MEAASPATGLFNHAFQNSLRREIEHSRTVKFAKHSTIYSRGDKSEHIYFIESGQIKLQRFSFEGKECILGIYVSGDVFGELYLSGSNEYMETAIAMKESFIKMIPRSEFFSHLTKESMFESFVKYLTVRIAVQQQLITNLVTVGSERRLAKMLLELAKKLGRKNFGSVIINHKITHEELSTMVGTTRPRISQFIQKFRKLDLIEIGENRHIIVKEKNLTEYLNQAI